MYVYIHHTPRSNDMSWSCHRCDEPLVSDVQRIKSGKCACCGYVFCDNCAQDEGEFDYDDPNSTVWVCGTCMRCGRCEQALMTEILLGKTAGCDLCARHFCTGCWQNFGFMDEDDTYLCGECAGK